MVRLFGDIPFDGGGDDALLLVLVTRIVARDLAERESQCCSFFAFTFTRGDASQDETLEMSVSVPGAHVAVLDGVQRLASSSMGSVRPA
jgi:hypothetical protein